MRYNPERYRLTFTLFLSAFIFFISASIGYGSLNLTNNKLCFQFFGCNAGILGYDFFLHFWSGFAAGALFGWGRARFPELDFRVKKAWWNGIVFIAIIALIGVGWEMLEYGWDHIQIPIVHEKLPMPDRMVQPSNEDTIGDLMADIMGGMLMLCVLRFAEKKIREKSDEKNIYSRI